MKKVSIVVPIYNVEEYLEQCLDSLVGQNCENIVIEIILVNDGSTDQSLHIAQKYAKEYEQIRLVSQRNGGLSKARNTGMKLAEGEYLCFVDSDDWLETDTVQEMVSMMEAEDMDLCLFGANGYLSDENGLKRQPDEDYDYSPEYEGILYPGKELFGRLFANREFKAQACMYMMKRELVVRNKLRFKEGIIHEDELFTPFVFYYAKRAGLTRKKFYNRRIRKNSIITGSKVMEHMKGYGAVFLGLAKCPGCWDGSRKVAESYLALGMENLQQCLNYYVRLNGEERRAVRAFMKAVGEEKKRQGISFPFHYYMYLLKEYMGKRGKRKCI